MKLNSISIAVGGAMAAMCGSSFALPLSDYTTNAAQYQDVYIAGSSALDPVLLRVGALQCASTGSTIPTSTIDYYVYSNEYVITCTLSAALPNGKTKLALHKESSNGSVNGTVAVANKQTRPFISVALLAAQPATTSACVLATTSFGGAHGVPLIRVNNCANQGTVGGPIANVVPDAGLSDLEPAIFSPSAAALLTDSTVPVVQTFGVPMSVVARNALQSVQGLTVGSDTEANMPSLTKDQVTSIYTGVIAAWSQLGVTAADWTAAYQAATNAGFTVTSTPADDQIYIARRTDQADTAGAAPNSGTQSSTEVYFTGQLCNNSTQAFLFYGPPVDTAVNKTDCGTATAAPTLGPVFAGAGGGNVAACLSTHDTGGRGAVGLLGAVDQPSTFGASSQAFRFIKVDGYSPSLYNTAEGTYHDWVESSFNVQPGLGANGGNGTVVQALKTAFTNTGVLADVAANITSSFGASVGLMANAFATVSGGGAPTYPVKATATQIAADPVANFTHEAQGTPNSCQPPVQVFPVNPTPGNNNG